MNRLTMDQENHSGNGVPSHEPTEGPRETPTERATGLRGLWGQVAQFGAVGLMGLLLYLHQRDNAASSRLDREMYREELRDTRKDHREATEQLTKGLHEVKTAVEVNTQAVKAVSTAIKNKQ